MPLPDNNPVWPPPECKEAERLYNEWGAWYSGDPQELIRHYQVASGVGGHIDTIKDPHSAQAIVSRTSRFFWGNPPDIGSSRDTRMHIPLAGDIASTSADLLFGEPPTFSMPEGVDGFERTQARLDRIVQGGLIPVLLEGAETCSALSGVYLRVLIDEKMSDVPVFDAIPPDSAVPKWRGNRLEAVTFWRKLTSDAKDKVYRHLELHEVGWVHHGLFVGTEDKLGVRVDLREHPETEGFAARTDDQGRIQTGADTLTAEYVPNIRPNRLLRGSPLGRSDYQGIEQTMDALDEVWSSLMRDIRLSKSRLIVPDVYLQSDGPGRGARFNADRELFSPVRAMPSADGVDLEMVQFGIRIDEHLKACRNLAVQALRGAGYSAQTFGEGDQGGPATATEVQARERRSYTTRDRKIEYWRPPLRRLARAALMMDRRFYGSQVGDLSQAPNVDWPDGVQTDIETVSRVVQMLDAANAASLRTKVQLVHPQWDADQVDTEVAAIEGAGAVAVDTDPNADREDNVLTGMPEPTDDPLSAVNGQALARVGTEGGGGGIA